MDVCQCLRLCVSYVYTAQYDGFLRKWCRHFECVSVFVCVWMTLLAHCSLLTRTWCVVIIFRLFCDTLLPTLVCTNRSHPPYPEVQTGNGKHLPTLKGRLLLHSALEESDFSLSANAVVSFFWRFFFCICIVFSLSLALSAFCLLLWGYFIIFSGWLMIFTEKGFLTFCVFVCFAFHFVCLNYCRLYRYLLCFVCVRLFFFHY